MNIVQRFPKSWRADILVVRSGGRDKKGNPLPAQEIPRTGVLVGPRATAEPVDRADVVNATAVLYDGDTAFAYLSTDRIRIPAGARMAGEWSIEGRPGEWPFGTEVGLVRA